MYRMNSKIIDIRNVLFEKEKYRYRKMWYHPSQNISLYRRFCRTEKKDHFWLTVTTKLPRRKCQRYYTYSFSFLRAIFITTFTIKGYLLFWMSLLSTILETKLHNVKWLFPLILQTELVEIFVNKNILWRLINYWIARRSNNRNYLQTNLIQKFIICSSFLQSVKLVGHYCLDCIFIK